MSFLQNACVGHLKFSFLIDGIMALLRPERSILHGLPDLMAKVAAEELQRMDYQVSECNVIYFPQVS